MQSVQPSGGLQEYRQREKDACLAQRQYRHREGAGGELIVRATTERNQRRLALPLASLFPKDEKPEQDQADHDSEGHDGYAAEIQRSSADREYLFRIEPAVGG